MQACGLRSDGSVACWKLFAQGEPVVAPDGEFTAVTSGWGHACAIRTDQTVTCWGSDSLGEATPPDGTFTAVSAGDVFTCGIRTNGSVACWGDDHYQQSSPPTGTFEALDAGRRHACAIRTGGGVACWGQDRLGQLDPRPTSTIGPLPAVSLDARQPVTWRANSLAPITSYDVRYRRGRIGDDPGPWTAWRSATTAVGGTLALPSGRYTCAEVRARDDDAGLSRWSNQECTNAPFDDRSLHRSGPWHELAGPAYYRDTALRASAKGASLTSATFPKWARVSIVATTCPTCGKVERLVGFHEDQDAQPALRDDRTTGE